MITVSDFIDILVHFHNNSTPEEFVKVLEDQTCAQWTVLKSAQKSHNEVEDTKTDSISLSDQSSSHGLVSISPDDSILSGVTVLDKRKIHRLPIIHHDTEQTVLCIINHQRILRFLLSKVNGIGWFVLLELMALP
jgi:predicted transcriptional regulator